MCANPINPISNNETHHCVRSNSGRRLGKPLFGLQGSNSLVPETFVVLQQRDQGLGLLPDIDPLNKKIKIFTLKNIL